MYKLQVLSLLLGVIGASVGQILQNGRCDTNITLHPDFDIDDFLGTWNEIASTETPTSGDCSLIEFSRNGENITVFHKTVRENFYEEHRGQAVVPANSSRLVLNLPSLSNSPIDFWVLSADNNSFMLTYGCENVGETQKRVYLWQLGRATSYPNMMIPANLNTTISGLFNISNNDLRSVSHSDNACFLLPNIAAGQPVILPGQCDTNITGVANFQAERFLGVWHQIHSYFSGNASGTCNRAQYSDGGGRVNVVNSQINNRTLFTIEGFATVVSNDSSGQLNVTLEVLPGVFIASELLVLGTDYNQWAVSYTCNNLSNNTRQVFSWVISRTRQLSPAAREEVNQVINSHLELNNRYYATTNQSDASCFYIPETVVDGEPIVFGGQCDLDIPVVSNFSAVEYMGLWHEIERYPAAFQFGSCNNAFYTLGDGVVDVFNTQVSDERLLTINGLAVPVADGKLVVSFPVEGTNLTTATDYWVLSANYSSYSLVYSCRNINDFQQQVTFWKLSRTKQLSNEAQTAINTVINSLDILNQTYFMTTNQSAQGCFYYPDPQPGVPVVFPGTCETNVSVVANFNATLFQGEWFEVEAYPKDPQEGQCVNHQFSVGNGSAALNFVSSNVDNQLLVSTNGQLTLYANETGGRFNLSFVSNGTTISFPYYVIATDYTDYALVYSCLDITGTDFRGIWAWKLSRSKQLSPNGNTQINNALSSTTVVLDNDYFEPIDQSDYSCFYFPELAPGEPVVISGQCETDIPVMQNFNASRYLGRWRLIESYPAADQIGQCNQATYSLASNGSILVYNNEVFNQTLNEITGLATLLGNGTEGRFNVTFPNVPFYTELWVLDTDYETYSIAYSCSNVGTQQRRVQSWKLSRTTSLTPAAITAINAVTSNVTVLNDRYYQTVNQSDAACFYYPIPGSGPTIFPGLCDENIPVVTGFDAESYMGLWHDIESYSTASQDSNCPNANYTLNTVLGRVDVYNTQVLENQTLDTISGYATLVPSNDTSAKLLVTFPTVNATLPYWVLDTDYRSYALVYSCQNIDEERRSVFSWKLSRTKSLNQTTSAIIDRIVDTIPVLDERYYINRDQSSAGCFYFPEPQPGVPVRFPGQCDQTINVVNNFNLSRFSGRWHEIEAYPKEEQTGDCINHEFVVNANNSLGMFSYNVIAESLGVTEGTVQFSSNSSEARMTIRFLSNGTTIEIPYWIIDTDYDNYALAYSCVNIDDDYRGVWSWKLSRTKELRPVDNATITNAIADIDVLNNQYYEDINQSNQACFFYPETAPGETVVFPGQCGNITAMPNFNASAYLGLWRTIESYPSEFQLGTCGDATYTLGDGIVVVYNTEVVNGNLSTIYGTAVPATDGSGRLYVTFPNASAVSEYLVLNTDYSTYSLVYSCVNSNNTDERTVYSWKLGRANSLPPAAIAAINATVNSIDVLDQRYYQIEDRTSSGCFYFPEPSNSTVIFRGRCNANIAVQPNFNAVAYTGIWHSIESYPAPFQDGTCGTASYTLDNATGVVFVENSQVLNQVLDVQTGVAVVVGNAQLAVTFEVNGVNVTTPYWILATDYTTYSLVYSCQNINDEYIQVNSWKLSRNQTLSSAAAQAINNTINNIQVLDQRYFVPEGQSEDDCFFYPDNQGGDVVLTGQCVPNNQVPAITNFNVTLFSGLWHEVARFPTDLEEGECAATNFSTGAQNSLTITQTIVANELQNTNIIPGTVSPDGRGVISATVGGVPFDALYILDTNYEDYALVYACRDLANDTKQIYSWKLARSRAGFSPAANATINQVVTDNIDLFEGFYSYTEQTSDACFHYPVYEERPDAIELEGACPDTIRGVPNFNATAYLGLWREFEKYPQANQFGTCDRAFYSPGDGNVLVRNTQVVNNTLLEQLGTAVVASTDGTGQLSVNFTVNGVEVNANYYILATDYNSYSLVYSCRNTQDALGHERRLVSSWKLSRTNSLSPQAQTAINLVINQTQGLNQQFYEPTSQSDDDCFYIPVPDPNSAPLFRGRCANYSGVVGFNASRYVGWWHEMERYSVDSNIGECISSQYTASGNAIQVVDTSVANGTAEVVTGTVTVINGVLTRILSNGLSEVIVVLDTDYDNYALLYSCSNVTVNGEEYRRVWSAKHSKSRTLSSVSVASLNATIESNSVLYQQFYQGVDQSDQSCFHYPEVQGQRVILPGQCDMNIPVVANFDVPAYGGTWYQIERYPQVHENPTSTCVGARYVLDEDAGVVNVLNWEVIDGELETIEGTATVNSTDGSAQLAVLLPVVGTNLTVSTSLYVLDTDYDEYALAYSCSNINAFQRSIGVWKLSRERTMSAAGSIAINAVIASREELDPRYFRSVSHSDGCPEPSSSTLAKSSILVLLICVVIQFLN